MRKSFVALWNLFFISISVYAQDFNAYASKTQLGQSDKLQITFSLKVNGNQEYGNITPPSFENFTVVAGPSTSSQSSFNMINGRSTSTKTISISYWLKPKKKGKFTIAPASVKVGGKIQKSNSITIEVTKSVPVSKNPKDPRYEISKKIHFVLKLSNRKPYVGEQIIAEYKLYFSTSISSPNIMKQPTFEGVWKENIKINQNGYDIRNENYKGQLYKAITIQKMVLIPQKSGRITLPSWSIEVPVQVQTGGRNFWGEPNTENMELPLSSKALILNVKPLPEKGKPKDFSGAVGDFKLSVSLNKENVEANRSVQLDVSVSGKGNLKLINLPIVEMPNELEKYDPKFKSSVDVSRGGLFGTIKNEYLVIPRYKGVYKIPKVEFSYFNPKTKKYVTLLKDGLTINVTKGKDLPKTNIVDSSENLVNKEKVNYIGGDILYIKQNTNLYKATRKSFIGSKWYNIWLYIPFILGGILFFILWSRNRRDTSQINRQQAAKLAQKRLKKAYKMLKQNNSSEFYIELERALFEYLMRKLSIKKNDLNKDYLKEILQSQNIELELISELMDILNDCEFARYTPSNDNSQMIQEYHKATNVILNLEKNVN